jgi:16S rRNA (cytosine1402-N4)-methyltransferase
MIEEKLLHIPVLLKEVIEGLNIAHLNLKEGVKAKFIDATLGAGGHSAEIVKKGGYVLGMDFDEEMLEVAGKRLREALRAMRLSEPEACPTDNFNRYFKLVSANFRDIDKVAKAEDLSDFDGILFDLGISSLHLENQRGFSFRFPGDELDMRISRVSQSVTASELINLLSKNELVRLFEVTLPRNKSLRLAVKIIQARETQRIHTVGDFIRIIERSGMTPTLPFLAVRIAVNSEMENLKEALPKAIDLLKKGGRLITISFHSGEDKLVKNFYVHEEKLGRGKIITKKPIIPTLSEIENNPRSRSAKMRIIEKL